METKTTIEPELWEWGKWARSCPSRSLSYPHQSPYEQYRGASISASMTITDDRALEIDQAIATVFHGDKERILLIIGYYQYSLSTRDIERITGISKSRVNNLILNSASWIDGYFAGKRAA